MRCRLAILKARHSESSPQFRDGVKNRVKVSVRVGLAFDKYGFVVLWNSLLAARQNSETISDVAANL